MNDEATQVYVFRAFIRQISPMIWRRLLLRGDQTFADLHYTLQLAFQWSDLHLHRFQLQAQVYCVPHLHSVDYTHDANEVQLQSVGLQGNQRFLYEYNFFDGWQVEIRLESFLSVNPKQTYPTCAGGAKAGPLEDCGGPSAYLAEKERYHPARVIRELHEMAESTRSDRKFGALIRETFPDLLYWAKAHQFDHEEINRRLHQYAIGDERWQQWLEIE